MNVENLTLKELDAEVARLEGFLPDRYHPSTNWAQGGPIIDRMHITLIYYGEEDGCKGCPWEAMAESGGHYIDQYPGDATGGPTALIAAMREYVRWSWENKA